MATRSNMSFQRSTSRMSEAAPTLLGLAPTMSTATPELEAIHDDHQRALEMCAQEQEHRRVPGCEVLRGERSFRGYPSGQHIV